MAGIWAGGIAAFVALAALGVFWLSRVTDMRRLNAAADAYAEREMARARPTAKP